MPNTSHISTPVKGMVSDLHLLNTDHTTYSFALNAMQEDFWHGNMINLQNEPSNICSVEFPPNYKIVGFKEIVEQNRTIYMLKNMNEYPNPADSPGDIIGEVIGCIPPTLGDKVQIGTCETCGDYYGEEMVPLEKQIDQCYCSFRTLIQSKCLNFDLNHPVDIEYKLTSCSLNIYFTDNYNERRYLYFDYEDNDISKPLIVQERFKLQIGTEEPCNTPVYQNTLDCQKIKVHPNYNIPCVNFLGFIPGGGLREGTYQVLLAYADAYGTPISSYFPSSSTMPLFERSVTVDTGTVTNKALSFEITGLKIDHIFQYYNIVIAQTINGFTEFVFVGTFNTTDSHYVYTGYEESIIKLSAQEVFFKRPYYQFAKGVTKANNYLFYVDAKEYRTLNLQPVANKIILNWETIAISEEAYRDPRNTFYFHTYQRDEVYAMGVIFEFNNGRETCAFHIPGRAPRDYDLQVICVGTNKDILIDETCGSPLQYCNPSQTPPTGCKPIWQIYNTASVIGTPHEFTKGCELNKCWEYGDFSYWESTEKYPNIPEVWGDLCGKCIRHHKMPDNCVSHIHDGFEGNKVFSDNNYIFPIGIRVQHDSVVAALNEAVTDGLITAEERQSIVGYRIVRGNRVGNKSVVAKGLFYNMFQYDKNDQHYYFSNYPYNDLSSDDFLDDVSVASRDRFIFHSPDTHFVNSGVGTYVKLETEEYGKSEGYFTQSDCEARQKFPSIFAQALALALGIAAAISATGEKQCKVVEYRGDTTKIQEEHKFNNTHTSQNQMMTLTFGSGTLTTTNTEKDTTEEKMETTDHFHNIPKIKVYDREQGKEVEITNSNKPEASGFDSDQLKTKNVKDNEHDLTPNKVTYTTCKGNAYQIFNGGFEGGGVIGTIINGLGFVEKVVLQRLMLGIFEMNKILDTIKELIPYKNYGVQYNSVAKYNNFTCARNGDRIRSILKGAYLGPTIQSVDEPIGSPNGNFTTININNWKRESSVYLKLNDTIADPTKPDDSKVSMREQFGGRNKSNIKKFLEKRFNRNVSSYYGSIKNNNYNQYGEICSINYIETSGCPFSLTEQLPDCNYKVFGGDTFINRFALKRKMPFFLRNNCKMPDGSDIRYEDLFNVGSPKYYYNTQDPIMERFEPLGNVELPGFAAIIAGILQAPLRIAASIADPTVVSLINGNEHRYDIRDDGGIFFQDGYVSLYNYGIPYFFVESDINVDYRHAENNEDKDFYPHQKDLKRWLEEGNVPIATDNYYFYDKTYSKQNKESVICKACILDPHELVCEQIENNRLIVSENAALENKNDNWLIFKANDYFDFPFTLGRLITADGIENDKVLVRLEKGSKIFNAYNTIQATGENIQVGTGGMFATRPQDIAITDLGYAGTQHTDILHTPFGHIWADAERGHVFKLSTGGQGIEEITKNGENSWFKENLPFQLKKDFPNFDLIDNNLNGVGLHYCFDRRFNRILITKLDYKVTDRNVKYDNEKKEFFIIDNNLRKVIQLNNPKYFCNKSWTISYNFFQNSWTSYHSYTPLFYTEHLNTFDSSVLKYKVINGKLGFTQRSYTHNFTNKSYQVFYGKLYPFIVEVQSRQDINNNTIQSIEYYLDVIRYHNEFDTFYNRTKTFSKAIVYNERQTSGMLNFKVSNPEDLSEVGKYPRLTTEGFEILTTNSENLWNFNQFWDVVRSQTNNMPIFNYDCNNVNKQLNPKALNYQKNDFDRALLRQRMCRVRLIQDIESNYKYIFNYSIQNQQQSFR